MASAGPVQWNSSGDARNFKHDDNGSHAGEPKQHDPNSNHDGSEAEGFDPSTIGWHASAKVYEWQEEYGDVGPVFPLLEEQLFSFESRVKPGEYTEALELEVQLVGPVKVHPIARFEDAGLHPVMLENVKLSGYKFPTPIQSYTIPAVNLGHDVVGIAQTGSGKTAAFMIPIISRLMGKAKKLTAPKPNSLHPRYDPRRDGIRAEPLVVIVVPTRELAIQVFDEARRLCYRSMLRPCVAYGGLPMNVCLDELGKGCDILIASPGRLVDLMGRPNVLTMSRVKYTVIDEADEMLDPDWEENFRMIMSGGDTNEDADHVYLMFSATFPSATRRLARDYMAQDNLHIRIGRPGQTHKNINQEVIFVERDLKEKAVYDLLASTEDAGRTLIFCNSHSTVDRVEAFLHQKGFPVTAITSNRNQQEREISFHGFRTGRLPILIATGVSARGWDIKDVKHVINFDLPSANYGGITEYIHRIGRTARIGNKGLATSFYNDRDESLAQNLVNILVECDCKVPDFLSHLKPEDKIDWNDNSDDEDDAEPNGTGDGDHGDSGGDAPDGGINVGWGADAPSTPKTEKSTNW